MLLVNDSVAPLTPEAVRFLANLSLVVLLAMKFFTCTKVNSEAGAINKKQMKRLTAQTMYYTTGDLHPI